MNDMGYTKYESDIERDNWEACFKIATSNGHTIAEAEECSDFSVGCMDCPFKRTDEIEQAMIRAEAEAQRD